MGRSADAQATLAQAEGLRLQSERRALSARRARAEQGREARQAAPGGGADAKGASEAVARLRRALLEPLAGQSVTGVQLTVSPSTPPRAAEGRVHLEGRFTDLLALSGRIPKPGSGLVLRRVQFAAGRTLALELDTFTVAAGWSSGAPPVAGEAAAPPARDPFRYANESEPRPVAAAAPRPREVALAPTPLPLPEPPPLRLVGFVRRPEGLRAAVATAAGVVIVGPGDLVLGHAVLKVDEDLGLRLRGPDGEEKTLFPAS